MNTGMVKVIFIGGSSRSGSTLLDRILGQIEGLFSLGEMYHIWERSFIENQLCGCGKPFRECEFWNTVVQEAFGGFHKIDAHRVLRLQRSVARTRYVPYLAFPRLRSRKFDSKLKEYIGILGCLYKAIAKVSGCNVLIDSSKAPSHGFVLSEIPGVELHVIHLVRDSRAVVYSWQRKKRRPEIYWKEAYMPTLGVSKAIQEWILYNWFTELLRKRASFYEVLRYERLASKVKPTIGELTKSLNLGTEGLGFFLSQDRLWLGVNHMVSGNPMRFKQGEIKIRPDLQWVTELPRFKRYLTTIFTYPLLRRYS